MHLLTRLLTMVSWINDKILSFGRSLACIAMVLMVFCILLQIFFRYALNNALPWPEEAARALMIWMMALVAPSAYRYAGFVAIDMVPDMLAPRLRAALKFVILLLATLVIIIMLTHALAHFNAPLLFDSSGLNRLLQDSGVNQLLGTDMQFKTAYVYLAMSVLLIIMLMVSLELILRNIGSLIWSEDAFPLPETPAIMSGS